MKSFALIAVALITTASAFDEADALFGKLKRLCGVAAAGQVVSDDPRDKDMATAALVMHVRGCAKDAVAISFHVGEDRSRTWIVRRTEAGLSLKHRHLHEDGTPDAVTMYGGDSLPPGTATRQDFPADAETKALFAVNGLEASLTNVWALEVRPGLFAYELNRENRHFRIEFDLTAPIAPPPAPWGGED